VLRASLALWVLTATPAFAQDVLELGFTPTKRAQIAVWIEREDGTFLDTIALTQAVAYRGIGNRPGALQMNSGYRWPYGRREGVLPVWAHRRAAAPGAELFPRVIFQDRLSEGRASQTSQDQSRDDYFCLAFRGDSSFEGLDAVTCASVFNSDKGRYITADDVSAGYAEPYEDGSTSFMRALSLGSLYPPRRDVSLCPAGTSCFDHPDLARFAGDARRILPNIDAIAMATPRADELRTIMFDVPREWPRGDYVAFIEINVEGDHNAHFSRAAFPTPDTPTNEWDTWAINFGYPYRGQPSVVFAVPFTTGRAGETSASEPVGYGDLEGRSGDVLPMSDGLITNDPTAAPGSGADRLRLMAGGARLRARVISTNVCDQPEPPEECGQPCSAADPCATGFLCAPDMTCVGECDLEMPPPLIADFAVTTHADIKHSHEWATLSFTVPAHVRSIASYEVRVSTEPITDLDSFMRAVPANAPENETVELVVPRDGAAGDRVEVDFGGLTRETQYYVGLRARDQCNDSGEIAAAEVRTTAIHFTTVSPCFVATAAYGTPLAGEVGALRRFRDRHLRTNAFGRALTGAYDELGPPAANAIRESEILRTVARMVVSRFVWLARLAP
jgi:hypothetical protein